MKIRIDVDVSATELRQFFGLPDVEPMQRELMQDLQERWRKGTEGYDPAALLRPLLPAHLQMLEQMQKGLWQGFTRRPKDEEDAEDT